MGCYLIDIYPISLFTSIHTFTGFLLLITNIIYARGYFRECFFSTKLVKINPSRKFPILQYIVLNFQFPNEFHKLLLLIQGIINIQIFVLRAYTYTMCVFQCLHLCVYIYLTLSSMPSSFILPISSCSVRSTVGTIDVCCCRTTPVFGYITLKLCICCKIGCGIISVAA